MNTIQEVYTNFVTNFNLNISNVSDSSVLYDRLNTTEYSYTNSMHESICEKSFINIFLLWEYFLEQSFVLYLCGSADLKGNTYKRYVLPTDREHAYKLIKGTKKYPDWTNLEEVNTLAELYFENSGTFNLLRNKPIEFIEMKTVRNKISHMSTQSDEQYKRLLTKRITQNQNVSVTQFLLHLVDGQRTYFSYYTDFILSYVEIICNK
ncbi:MAG: hypothetical protein K0S18_1319 [Anaerocolumna sp.]|jgi:hypothetical protein|nr:hypothetical protein [Anaerocolumna sp.]